MILYFCKLPPWNLEQGFKANHHLCECIQFSHAGLCLRYDNIKWNKNIILIVFIDCLDQLEDIFNDYEISDRIEFWFEIY